MSKLKKYSTDKKLDLVQEPAAVYNSKSEISSDDERSELLKKLIQKGIEQCERGETTPHEIVMARFKKKYNLPL